MKYNNLQRLILEILEKHTNVEISLSENRLKYYVFLIDHYDNVFNQLDWLVSFPVTECQYKRSNNLFYSQEFELGLDKLIGYEVYKDDNNKFNFNHYGISKIIDESKIDVCTSIKNMIDTVSVKFIFNTDTELKNYIDNLIGHYDFGVKI